MLVAVEGSRANAEQDALCRLGCRTATPQARAWQSASSATRAPFSTMESPVHGDESAKIHEGPSPSQTDLHTVPGPSFNHTVRRSKRCALCTSYTSYDGELAVMAREYAKSNEEPSPQQTGPPPFLGTVSG